MCCGNCDEGPPGPEGPAGFTDFHSFANEGEVALTSFVTPTSLLSESPVLVGGTYYVSWQSELRYAIAFFEIDSVEVGRCRNASSGTNPLLIQVVSGFATISLAPGSHSLVVTAIPNATPPPDGLARRTRVALWRVGP